jgi:high-affinity nickel-transport protein
MGHDAAPLGFALLGLMLGMRHATDPDHVIAVTTILSRERRLSAAARIGVVWGLGHTLTVLIVGASIIVFKLAIPSRLGLAMEFAVALVLILLGAGSASKLIRRLAMRLSGGPMLSPEQDFVVHAHAHVHEALEHAHPHVHVTEDAEHDFADVSVDHEHLLRIDSVTTLAERRRLLRSFGVGLVHGLAGSAAIALLVLSAIPDPLWATLYLGIFCTGTIVGMGLITVAIATPFMLASQRVSWLHQGFVTGSGMLSFCFGLFLAYQIGIVDHLFVAVPLWTPH